MTEPSRSSRIGADESRAASRRPRAPAPSSAAGPARGSARPAAWALDHGWALTPWLAALALAWHAWFPFVGEPVSDDFDYLHHTILSWNGDWLDGCGANFYWRPLGRQLYYRLLGDVILAHPARVAALQTALAALASLLLYRALRRRWRPSWAAAASSFPLFMECARLLVSCPTNFQDLGAILFSALALHEASRTRLWSALAALLAALLCKENALVTALLLPWMPGHADDDRRLRRHWVMAAGALAAAWGALYGVVVQRSGLRLLREAGGEQALSAPWIARFVWACRESLADAFGLPALTPPLQAAGGVVFAAIAAGSIAMLAASPAARTRARAAAAWIAWGVAWFALGSAMLADAYPDWRPYRSAFGAFGLGVACTALVGAAQPALLGALVVARLATFAMSPGPPEFIEATVVGGFSIDFPKHVRIQRLIGETRRELVAALPHPAHGTRVAGQYPRQALFALAGDKSIQVWYRDTTLHWVAPGSLAEPGRPVASLVLQFQPQPPRQVAIVDPAALSHLDAASRRVEREDWAGALEEADRADALQHDRGARVFASMLAGKRALALGGLGRRADAERQATLGLALWSTNDDARFVLACEWMRSGRLAEAEAQFDTLLARNPEDSTLLGLREATRRARRGAVP